MLAILPLILMQVGPAPVGGPVSAVPDELYEQRQLNRQRQAAIHSSRPDDPVRTCAARADVDAEAARAEAEARLAHTSGLDRAVAGHCLGYALSALTRWDEAATAFSAAREAVPPGHATYGARLGAAAASARLAAGQPAAALAELDALEAVTQPDLAALIALDRARALVALDRAGEAQGALATARAAAPDSDEAWLLSATLARRAGDLAEAQTMIERAAMLRPTGPEIGLEAGVIAMLGGRQEAAVKSWQSVVASAPGTPAAATAQGYLAQVAGE